MKHNTYKGFGLIEVIIGTAIITISIAAVMGVFYRSLVVSASNLRATQASYIAEEGIEAIKILRDDSWDGNIATLTSGTNYYLSFDAVDGWTAGTSYVSIDRIFYRTFQIEDVNRDAVTKDISSVGVDDPNTKKVVVNVAWMGREATSTRTLSTYIVNLFDN